jgi:hypothetical protein
MNITRKTLEETSKISENEYECHFCGKIFPDLDSLTEHVECDHNYEIQSIEDNLSKIAIENKTALEKWLEQKKVEILQNASQTELELYTNDVSGMALNKKLNDELWKLGFRQPQRLSTLDTKIMDSLKDQATKLQGRCPEGSTLVEIDGVKMCVPSHLVNELFQYRAEKASPRTHQPDPISGQSDQTFDMPESPEAKKVLERSSEELSETKKKHELMTVLIALLRDKEKKRSN